MLRYQAILLDDKRFLNRELHGDAADGIIGGNTGLRNVMEMVRQVAPLNNTVLILGETGTGKESIANAIHFSSPRRNGPFITVNCGALPENLIDSELFGHERGAFTGAVAESRGRFERADGGTIFLDEIGELPPNAQVRLLRVLQNREVERVGGKAPDPRRYTGDRGNAPQPAEHGGGRQFPRGPLVPVRASPSGAAGAAAEERHAGLTRHFGRREQGTRHRGPGLNRARGAAAADGVRLARQRARAGDPDRARAHPASWRATDLQHDSAGPGTKEYTAHSAGNGLAHFTRSIWTRQTQCISPRYLNWPRGRSMAPEAPLRCLGINPSTLRSRLDKLGIQLSPPGSGSQLIISLAWKRCNLHEARHRCWRLRDVFLGPVKISTVCFR